MDEQLLQQKTKQFHIDVLMLCEHLTNNVAVLEIPTRHIRSAGWVGANDRTTVRATSKFDFIYKIEVFSKRQMKPCIG